MPMPSSRSAFRVGRGDDLVVTCQPAHREFAVALVEAGYRAGARSVDVEYTRSARARRVPPDRAGQGDRPRHAVARRARARDAEARDGDALDRGRGRPRRVERRPGQAARGRRHPLGEALRRRAAARRDYGKRRWSIAGWPTESWAAAVYPKLGSTRGAAEARARPARLLPRRAGRPARRHRPARPPRRAQEPRAAPVAAEAASAIELRGPGTELDVALARGRASGSAAARTNFYGKRTAPNLPTEECFTSPIAAATEGTFRCSQPLMFQGR